MNFNHISVDLSGWKETGEMAWFLEYECPNCPKMYRGEVSVGMYSPGMDEVPVFAQVSSGFFLMRQSPAMVHYPLDEISNDVLQKVRDVIAHNMAAMIMNHFAEDPEAHALPSGVWNNNEES